MEIFLCFPLKGRNVSYNRSKSRLRKLILAPQILKIVYKAFINTTLHLSFYSFNPDPRVRNTFWSLVLGGMFSAMPVYCVGQMMVQRVMSAKSEKTVRM